jgi:hypothetical protein
MKCYDGDIDPREDEEQFIRTITNKPEIFLTNFFRRSWFQLIWTVQEVAASRRCLVLCGKATMDWDKPNLTLLSLTTLPKLVDINISIQTHWFYRMYLSNVGKNFQLSNRGPFERANLFGDDEWNILISVKIYRQST